MDFLSRIKEIAGIENVFLNERMDKHTTFRVGGPARYMAVPSDEIQINSLIRLCGEYEVPYYIVGNGSNLLVSDKGYDGLIILIGRNMSDISVCGDVISAGAGALLSEIGKRALNERLTGFEFASGIPGTLGGACVMNAGAYGKEMKDVLISVRAITPDGDVRDFHTEELGLGYRQSIFIDGGYAIVKADVRLKPGSYSEISEKMAELSRKRREKQPLEYPSAGSTFKRPEGMFAGQLIEQSGLKGMGIGGACVSEKHAGFIVNKGNATAKDIYDTIQLAVQTVAKKQGVKMEPEVRIVGEF